MVWVMEGEVFMDYGMREVGCWLQDMRVKCGLAAAAAAAATAAAAASKQGQQQQGEDATPTNAFAARA